MYITIDLSYIGWIVIAFLMGFMIGIYIDYLLLYALLFGGLYLFAELATSPSSIIDGIRGLGAMMYQMARDPWPLIQFLLEPYVLAFIIGFIIGFMTHFIGD